jgi:outer membrane protein assembly factor BamB
MGTLLAAAIWDFNNNRLFVASNYTHLGGVAAAGSVRQLNPSTGAIIWETPLSGGPVMGTPTLSAGGVIAAGTYDIPTPTANRVYLLNASNGAIVNAIQEDALIFSQPVFADTHLFIATTSGQLTAYSIAP